MNEAVSLALIFPILTLISRCWWFSCGMNSNIMSVWLLTEHVCDEYQWLRRGGAPWRGVWRVS